MVQQFSLESSCSKTRCLISVSGDLDITTSPKLVVACREALRGGASTIAVNLSSVGFMDSSGLAGLINVHRSVERAGGRLIVVCPDGPVRRLFAISGTEALLGVEPELTAAA
jgi:anti-sigma B factor antagonist